MNAVIGGAPADAILLRIDGLRLRISKLSNEGGTSYEINLHHVMSENRNERGGAIWERAAAVGIPPLELARDDKRYQTRRADLVCQGNRGEPEWQSAGNERKNGGQPNHAQR